MQNSWITTGEDYRVDEAAKRSFSCGNANTIKVASAGEAEKWKLELVSIGYFFHMHLHFWYFFIVVNIYNTKFAILTV